MLLVSDGDVSNTRFQHVGMSTGMGLEYGMDMESGESCCQFVCFVLLGVVRGSYVLV